MLLVFPAYSRLPHKRADVLLPADIKNFPIEKNFLLEDLNGDKLLDIVFFRDNRLYLSIQKPSGDFSSFETLVISLSGAFDFGDVFPGDNKEILVQHRHGISCFQKKGGQWDTNPVLLVRKPTSFPFMKNTSLRKERFSFDLNGNNVSELILWHKEYIYFYYKNNSGDYSLKQSFSLGGFSSMSYPGVQLLSSPFDWLLADDRPALMKPEWPEKLRYVMYSFEFGTDFALISDFNQDGKKDFIHIVSTEVHDKTTGVKKKVYQYRIHFHKENNRFSEEPDRVYEDPVGILISPYTYDVEGDGLPDLVRCHVDIQEGILSKPKTTVSFFPVKTYDYFPAEPSQVFEVTGIPLTPEPVLDITGDGKKDLVLIHSQVKGFSLGNMISKFIKRGVNVLIRIIPYDGKEFSRDSMLQTKIKMNYSAGMPINISGDYNGDGKKDLLVVDENQARIFLFQENEGFSRQTKMKISKKNISSYHVEDIDKNGCSDILFFIQNKMVIYYFSSFN